MINCDLSVFQNCTDDGMTIKDTKMAEDTADEETGKQELELSEANLPERGSWTNKLDFILSVVGLAIGPIFDYSL